MKAIEQYVHVVLFIMLYKPVLTFTFLKQFSNVDDGTFYSFLNCKFKQDRDTYHVLQL